MVARLGARPSTRAIGGARSGRVEGGAPRGPSAGKGAELRAGGALR